MIGAVCGPKTWQKPMPLSQPKTAPIGMGLVGIGTLGSTPMRFLMTGAGAIIPHSSGMVSPMDTVGSDTADTDMADMDTAVATEGVDMAGTASTAVVASTAAAAFMAAVAVTVVEPCL